MISSGMMIVIFGSSRACFTASRYMRACFAASSRRGCAVVIVINGAHAPARVQISLPAEQVPEYITTAWTMLPFNFYSVLLRNGSSASTVTSTSTATMPVLEDVLPANGVVHYRLSSADHGNELGCPGPR